MGQNAVQLANRILAELLGIGRNGFERNVDVAADHSALGVVEGNDVGEVIVVEEFAVHPKDSFIVGQDVGQRSRNFAVGFGNFCQPGLNNLLGDNVGELYVFS